MSVNRRSGLWTLAAVLAAALLMGGSCGTHGDHDGDDDDDGGGPPPDPVTFLDTYHFFFNPADFTLVPAELTIVSSDDLDGLEDDSGETQDAAEGLILGTVVDVLSPGTPLAGAVVEARDADGVLEGTVVYADAAGTLDAALTSTSASGEFAVFNVDPADFYLVAATTAASGGRAIFVRAGAVSVVRVDSDVVGTTLTYAGDMNHLDPATGEIDAADDAPNGAEVTIFGIPPAGPSAVVGAGAFGPVAGLQRFSPYLVKAGAAGHIDTYQVVETEDANLAAGDADLAILAAADRADEDWTPSTVTLDATKGMIRGRGVDVAATGVAGLTWEARDVDGNVAGVAVYEDAAGTSDAGRAFTAAGGGFKLFNVTPGWVMVRVTSAGSGNTWAYVFADGLSYLGDVDVGSPGSVTVAGSVADQAGDAVSAARIGIVATANYALTDSAGEFENLSLYANSTYILKVSR